MEKHEQYSDLNYQQENHVDRIKLVPVTGGSCTSDSMLVDAIEKETRLSLTEIQQIKLSKFYYEEDLKRKTMKFDKTRF